MPQRMQLHQKYFDRGFEVVTLNMEGADEFPAVEEVIRKLNLEMPHLALAEGLSDEGVAAVQLPNGLLPAINIYDRGGELSVQWEGDVTDDELRQRIESLLQD